MSYGASDEFRTTIMVIKMLEGRILKACSPDARETQQICSRVPSATSSLAPPPPAVGCAHGGRGRVGTGEVEQMIKAMDDRFSQQQQEQQQQQRAVEAHLQAQAQELRGMRAAIEHLSAHLRQDVALSAASSRPVPAASAPNVAADAEVSRVQFSCSCLQRARNPRALTLTAAITLTWRRRRSRTAQVRGKTARRHMRCRAEVPPRSAERVQANMSDQTSCPPFRCPSGPLPLLPYSCVCVYIYTHARTDLLLSNLTWRASRTCMAHAWQAHASR